MSTVNELMAKRLRSIGARVRVFDLAPVALVAEGHSIDYGARKASLVLARLAQFVARCLTDRPGAVYFGLSGGVGQLFELPFALVARLFRLPVFFHHHSFAYLDSPNLITKALFACAPKGVHIALCQQMGRKLSAGYGVLSGRIQILSNAAMMDLSLEVEPGVSFPLRTIGYLGNISTEKGIGEYLAVMEMLSETSPGIRGLVAGPFADAGAERLHKARMSGKSKVEYLGPVYGADKVRFLNRIDVLLFPSRYANEAEPLTIYEALANGVPVIAWDCGCIGEVLSGRGGLVVPRGEDFVTAATTCIKRWVMDEEEFFQSSLAARARFSELRRDYVNQGASVLAELTAGKTSGPDAPL